MLVHKYIHRHRQHGLDDLELHGILFKHAFAVFIGKKAHEESAKTASSWFRNANGDAPHSFRHPPRHPSQAALVPLPVS